MVDSRTAALASAVDPEAFRPIAGRFASGLTVLTSTGPTGPLGTTVSAVCSLSLEPPMMLVCLNRSSSVHDDLVASGRFALNILASTQGAIARQFATRGADKFAGVAHRFGPGGIPYLEGAVANIACEIESVTHGGTHAVLLGRVVDAASEDVDPLVYYRSRFGAFLPEG